MEVVVHSSGDVRIRLVIRGLHALFVSLALCLSGAAALHAEEKVKVGAVLSLSGGLSMIGEGIRNGILLAQSELDPGSKVQFIFEDDAFQSARSVSAVKKLISVDKVSALITFGSSTSLAAAPLAEKAEVPLFAISGMKKVAQDRRYIIRFFVDVVQCSRDIAAEAVRRGYQRVFSVATVQDAMLDFSGMLEEQLRGRIVGAEEYEHGNSDFRAAASKAVGLRADAVFLALLAPQASIFARQARSAGYKGAFFGAYQLENHIELEAAGEALKDAWFASTIAGVGSDFVKRYESTFRVTMEHNAPYGYDIAKMIIEAVEKKADINSYAHGLKKFQGALGIYGITPDNDFSVPTGLNTAARMLEGSP